MSRIESSLTLKQDSSLSDSHINTSKFSSADWSVHRSLCFPPLSLSSLENLYDALIVSATDNSYPLVTLTLLLYTDFFSTPDVIFDHFANLFKQSSSEDRRTTLADIIILWLHVFPLTWANVDMYPRLNLLYKELKSNGTTAETTLRSAVRRFYRMRKNERVFSKTFLAAVDQIPTDFDSNRVVGAFLQSDPIQIALQLHHYELALRFSIPPIEFLGTSFSPVKHLHRFHTLHQNLKSWPLFLLSLIHI